jgi:bifunctional DNA primase/polymerase-like protein
MSSKRDNTGLALRYAEEGIPVMPLHGVKDGRCTCGDERCEHSGRHSLTKHGLLDATTDSKQIERLWKKNPNAKIGIAVSSAANLGVLETRGRRGRRKLDEITASNGTLPRTVTIRDHNRRQHFFKFNSTQVHGMDIAEGVRLLGDGDLIVAPSRISRSNGKRRFADGRAFGEIEIAQAPDWLVKISLRACATTEAQPSAEDEVPEVPNVPVDAAMVEVDHHAIIGPRRSRRKRRALFAAEPPAGAEQAPQATVSPSTLPSAGEDIPAFLDRRPLSPGDQRAFDDLKATFESGVFRTAWDSASAVVQRHVIELLRTTSRG